MKGGHSTGRRKSIVWGAVGHRDQGGAYTSVSVAQQATDLKAMFGTRTMIIRGIGESSTPAQTGSDLTAYQAVGIEPVVEVAVSPPWGTFTTQADAFSWANTNVATYVATTTTAKYYEIGNEWTIDGTVGAHAGDGSLPANWSGQTWFTRMVGAVAGAVAAIRAGNPSAKIASGCTSGWTAVGLPVALAQALVSYAGDGLNHTWDYTVLHWYNDVVGGNQMGLPDNFSGGLNAYTLLKGAGKPLFISEFGSSNGNSSTNNAACGTNLTALMANFVLHKATTATEPGVACATTYEMYQQPNVGQTDYFLYTYTSGATGAIAAQGTAIGAWIAAHP
jgi:hypothetical protein